MRRGIKTRNAKRHSRGKHSSSANNTGRVCVLTRKKKPPRFENTAVSTRSARGRRDAAPFFRLASRDERAPASVAPLQPASANRVPRPCPIIMRFARAVTAAVALAIASTVCRALPIEPYRRNFSALEFVQHALMHENAWTLVLRERLVKLPPLPYKDRFPDAGALILRGQQPGAGGYCVRLIVARVLEEYADMGSFVDYAAQALLGCIKCFVTKHLLLQSLFIIRLFEKNVNPDTILMELIALNDNIVVALDKMALVPSDLGAIFELFWEVARLMQFECMMHHMRKIKYPANSQKKLNDLKQQFNDYVTENCTELVLNRQFFLDINISVASLMAIDDVLNVTVTTDDSFQLAKDHAMFFGMYLRNMGFEAMPQTLWGQIFYHSEKIPIKDVLDETNVPITPPSPRSVKSTTTTTITSTDAT